MINWKKFLRKSQGDPEERLCRYFHTPCLKHGCMQWVEVRGKSPTTGETLPRWMCVDEALLNLAFQQGMASKSNAAAVESLRNVLKQNDDREYLLKKQVAASMTKALRDDRSRSDRQE